MCPESALVSEGQIRVLAEPVSLTRDGITLTVEEIWAASDRTLIKYSVDGLAMEIFGCESPAEWLSRPRVSCVCPDGELAITQPQSSFGWATGYQLKSLYPAIPSTQNEVTFVMPCLILAKPGKAPEKLGIGVPTGSRPTRTPSSLSLRFPPQSRQHQRFCLHIRRMLVWPPMEFLSLLDRAVQMEDGYLIYVTIHYENSGLGSIDIPFDPATFHLLDATDRK